MNVSKSPNSLGTFYTNLGTSVNNHINTIAKTTNDTVNSVTNSLRNIAKNTPNTFGSLVPAAANIMNDTGSMFNNTKNMLSNTGNTLIKNINGTSTATNTWLWPTIIFIIITIICITFILINKDKLSTSINNIIKKIRSFFNKPVTPIVDASHTPVLNVNAPVSPHQDQLNAKSSGILNKLLPAGKNEVFNVSKNDFPYQDAEPLCNALGAELATYDQVKEAWAKGADWCNYGWVKGQAAVYPIQQETWNKIQSGPEENRNSCGAIGVNGGYFENPDMKFGVNCYGVKPMQSAHDEEVLMKNGSIPLTVPALEVDKKIQEFKKEADNMGLLPFNNEKWSN